MGLVPVGPVRAARGVPCPRRRGPDPGVGPRGVCKSCSKPKPKRPSGSVPHCMSAPSPGRPNAMATARGRCRPRPAKSTCGYPSCGGARASRSSSSPAVARTRSCTRRYGGRRPRCLHQVGRRSGRSHGNRRPTCTTSGNQASATTCPNRLWPSSNQPPILAVSPRSTAARRHRRSTSKPTTPRGTADVRGKQDHETTTSATSGVRLPRGVRSAVGEAFHDPWWHP